MNRLIEKYKERIASFDREYDDGKWSYWVYLADSWYLPDWADVIHEATLREVGVKLASAMRREAE